MIKTILFILGFLGVCLALNEGRFFPWINMAGIGMTFICAKVYPVAGRRKSRSLIGNDYYKRSRMVKRFD